MSGSYEYDDLGPYGATLIPPDIEVDPETLAPTEARSDEPPPPISLAAGDSILAPSPAQQNLTLIPEDEPGYASQQIRAVWRWTPPREVRRTPSAASLADTVLVEDAPVAPVQPDRRLELLTAVGAAVAIVLLGVAAGIWWAGMPDDGALANEAFGVMSVEAGD